MAAYLWTKGICEAVDGLDIVVDTDEQVRLARPLTKSAGPRDWRDL